VPDHVGSMRTQGWQRPSPAKPTNPTKPKQLLGLPATTAGTVQLLGLPATTAGTVQLLWLPAAGTVQLLGLPAAGSVELQRLLPAKCFIQLRRLTTVAEAVARRAGE